MNPHEISEAKAILDFMYAGNSTFTLRSEKTGAHFTYKVKKADKRNPNDPTSYFVKVLAGPDNTADYVYVGMITNNKFRVTSKSRMNEKSAPVASLIWALERFVAGRKPENLGFYHEGRCGRCGRPLTVPESVATGIGPECAAMMGISQVTLPTIEKKVAQAEKNPVDPALVTRMVAAKKYYEPEAFYLNLQGDKMTEEVAVGFWTRLFTQTPYDDDRFWGDEAGRVEAAQEQEAYRREMQAEESINERVFESRYGKEPF